MNPDKKVPQLHCSAGAWHDQIRYLIIHWAQRNGYDVHSEDDYDKYKPDLVLRQIKPTPRKFKKNAPIVFVEIQKDQSDIWIQGTIDHYRGKTLSIFQPMSFDQMQPFHIIKKAVEDQISMEVNIHKKQKEPDDRDEYIMVGKHRCKRKNAWRYK